MMKVLETRNIKPDKLEKILLGRHAEPELARIETSVRSIVTAVRREGDRAVARFTKKFDRVSLRPDQFMIAQEDVRAAAEKLSSESLQALRKAHKNIVAFHKRHLRRSWLDKTSDGSALGQKLTPIEKVGVYCPGGKAFYPSSVLMNIAPAQVAGCKEIVMVSPPSSDGTIHPGLLAAADIAGATRVYRIGGAQAVAALAYGTKTVPRVDKITGPGNIYVATAKRIVANRVGIDMEAGPSEILIIADSAADPRLVAADILSQAEHDEMARSILVTTARRLVDRVLAEVDRQLQTSNRKKIIRASLKRGGLIIVARSIKEAIEIANLRAPEHLELMVSAPESVLEKITNAGVVFLGAQTPNSVGDYMAGANHILPTGGRARFSSPLTAEDFRKVTNIVKYSPKKLKGDADDIMEIAELEGLTAHAEAVWVRIQK